MLVIIHGWSDNHNSFKTLTRRLIAAGINREAVAEIHLGDYLSLDDRVTFHDLAEALDRAWDDTRENRALPRTPRSVDVVVHSTGALVIRDWLINHFTPDTAPIHRLLMLAPANFGSPLAHTGRSLIGRATKGWRGNRLFETGTHILKGLELASPITAQLAARDRFTSDPWYGPGRMLCTVLTGNTGYSGIASIANRAGSDGAVRVSTANLDCARLDVDFTSDPLQPSYTFTKSTGPTAFGVMDGEDHSSVACKGGGPRRDKTLDYLIRAMQVTDTDFSEWCETLARQNREVMAKRNSKLRQTHFHGYQNTVVHVRDQYGNHVPDYLLELYLNEDTGRRARRATQRVQEEVITSVHAWRDDASYRSFLINCNVLRKIMTQHGDRMKIGITASPDIRSHDVGYRTYTDEDIGSISLDAEQLDLLFQDNRTVFITITLCREQSERVFRLLPYKS